MTRDEFQERFDAYVKRECKAVGIKEDDKDAHRAFEVGSLKTIINFMIKDEQREIIAKTLGL